MIKFDAFAIDPVNELVYKGAEKIRLRPKIGDHDFEAKTRSVKKLLADGDKVKITIMFRGREITHAQLGWKLLEKMMEALKGTVTIEKQPQKSVYVSLI